MANNKKHTANVTFANHEYAKLTGTLCFSTVSQLREKCNELLANHDKLILDFSDAESLDSSGLALLIALTRSAKEQNKMIKFEHIPKQLADIAKVSSLDKILPLQ